MSADNGIYIGHWRTDCGKKIYSVIETSNIDHLVFLAQRYGKDSKPYIEHINNKWGKGPFFHNYDKAIEYAHDLYRVTYTEYGVVELPRFLTPPPQSVIDFAKNVSPNTSSEKAVDNNSADKFWIVWSTDSRFKTTVHRTRESAESVANDLAMANNLPFYVMETVGVSKVVGVIHHRI